MNESILKLLKERYFLTRKEEDDSITYLENSWEDLVNRISGIYPAVKKDMEEMNIIPSTPTLMNANTDERYGTLSSCFPMAIEQDSLKSIHEFMGEVMEVTRMSGGCGNDFSNLRGANEPVKSNGKNSGGVLSFVGIYDGYLDGIMQGGARRGAGMTQLNIHHPDILFFIDAKKDLAKYTRSNFSVRVPNSFYHVLETAPDTQFYTINVVDKKTNYIFKEDKTPLTFKEVWDKIIVNAHLMAEPGVFNSDIAFDRCTTTNYDKRVLSNPCAEHVNHPNTSCSLMSINLSNLVKNNKFDWNKLDELVELGTNFLTKTFDINKFPTDKIKEATLAVKPVGLGFMGLGHALYKLNIPYDSKEGIKFAEDVMYRMTVYGMLISLNNVLDKKYEKYSAFDYDTYVNANKRYFEDKDRFKKVTGMEVNKFLELLKTNGIATSTQTSIAPTGTISFMAETSSGVEPIFALCFARKKEIGNKVYETIYLTDPVFENYVKEKYADKANQIFEIVSQNKGSCQTCDLLTEQERNVFKVAGDLTPMQHLDMLEVVAKWVSMSCSKTINLPNNATKEEVSEVFLEAYKRGVIGVTVYRDGCREGILVHTESSKKTSMLPKSTAPKRPKELEAEVHTFVINKRSFYVVVGLIDGDVYEIFTGENHNEDGSVYIPKNIKKGVLVKEKKKTYVFKAHDEHLVHEYVLTNGHSSAEADSLTRMISTACRHSSPLEVIVHQLEKSWGSMTSFSKVLSRTLKKYIKDGSAVHGESCPTCGSKLIRVDGCISCETNVLTQGKDCTYTKCG